MESAIVQMMVDVIYLVWLETLMRIGVVGDGMAEEIVLLPILEESVFQFSFLSNQSTEFSGKMFFPEKFYCLNSVAGRYRNDSFMRKDLVANCLCTNAFWLSR